MLILLLCFSFFTYANHVLAQEWELLFKKRPSPLETKTNAPLSAEEAKVETNVWRIALAPTFFRKEKSVLVPLAFDTSSVHFQFSSENEKARWLSMVDYTHSLLVKALTPDIKRGSKSLVPQLIQSAETGCSLAAMPGEDETIKVWLKGKFRLFNALLERSERQRPTPQAKHLRDRLIVLQLSSRIFMEALESPNLISEARGFKPEFANFIFNQLAHHDLEFSLLRPGQGLRI